MKTPTCITCLACLLILVGCGPKTYQRPSLPDVLVSKELIERVGAPLGVKVTELTGGGGNNPETEERHGQFSVILASGTPGDFMKSLMAETERLALSSAEGVYGTETVAPEQLRDFAFHYGGKRYKGLARFYSANVSSNELRLIVFGYEHRR